MEWVSMKIYLPSEEIDALVEELMGVGIRGFAIEDPYEFEEFLETSVYYDYIEDDVMRLKESPANVTIYLPANAQGADMLEQAKGIALARGAEYALENLREEDWANNWKQYFKQFYVDDILIIPSWEEVKPEDRDKMIIHIDPGTAFGTGMHETTQLCIRQLKKYVTKDTELLDVGTGSGILSIIALKLGARHAVGTDLDPCAVPCG
mgnify:CR=1 FL=1